MTILFQFLLVIYLCTCLPVSLCVLGYLYKRGRWELGAKAICFINKKGVLGGAVWV